MALHDVDKNSLGRSNPTPNAHGKIIPEAIKAHSTVSTSYSLDDSSDPTYAARIQMLNNSIVVYDGSNQRIIFGVLPDGTYGMAISKPGYNVSDAF